ncbi:MAG: associated Golgi protein [Marmoricola sp.]|nr:associated Golgi protein [Marmoricola sp.]
MPGLDLNSLDPYAVVGVTVLLVLVQTALVVGFLVPGGKAAVLSGVVAGLGHVHLAVAFGAIVLAAVVGAGIGYALGRRHGTRIFEHRLLRRHADRIASAQDLLRRRAGFALVVGRSVAVLRATSPALAGAAGVPVRQFALWNVVGALVWGSATVGLGYLGGASIPALLGDLPPVVLVSGAVVLVVLGLLAPYLVRVRRATPVIAHVPDLRRAD